MAGRAEHSPPLGAVAPVLDDVIRGWVLGEVVGTVAAQRRYGRGRGLDEQYRRVREAWDLLGAAIGLAIGLLDELS